MLTIQYEQSLVETTVFLAVRNNEQTECDFHLAIDPIYEVEDEELRQREFAPIFRDFFTRLTLDRVIAGLIAERPHIAECVDQCVVREAPRQKAESAELFVNGQGNGQTHTENTLVIQACPQSLITPGRFIIRMRRELLHVADMLDDRFGYQRETFPGVPSHQNLLRDRYRVLWDIHVESRLEGEGRKANGEKQRLLTAFGRVFANDEAGGTDAVFHRVFDTPSLTHRRMMDWARQPDLLFDTSSPRQSEQP